MDSLKKEDIFIALSVIAEKICEFKKKIIEKKLPAEANRSVVVQAFAIHGHH